MNKRLVCLLLCLVMLAMCFVGCAKKTDEEAAADISDEASDSAMTLAMYLLCESEVSAEQAQKIETAVNKITKPKFKTQLKLYFYTADKYYEALDASFAARLEAEEAGLITDNTPAEGEKVEDETFINEEWGITEIKYPTIDSFQVDIFYVGGYDRFQQYKEEGMLSKLDDELSHDSKLINDYISANYIRFMKELNSGTYAIPNNAAIGKYQYLLLNKEVLAKTRYNTTQGLSQFTSIDCDAVKSVLEQVKNEYTDFTPLYSSLGPDGIPLVNWKFWGVDENGALSSDFSVLASAGYTNFKYKEFNNSYLSSNNILSEKDFKDTVKAMKEYKQNGYFGTEDQLAQGKIAVAYMEGSTDIPVKYSDDYVAVPIGKPVMETQDLYENMFAVSSYSSSVNRSMEIITYLNTNEEFRNLLLYGIEGENYELVNSEYFDENGDAYKVVRRLNNNYLMAPEKTGNALITYTLEGGDPTLNDYIKLQNANVTISVTMGFTLNTELHQVRADCMEGLRQLSASVFAKLQAASYADVMNDTYWDDLATEVNNDTNYGILTTMDPEGKQTVIGILQQYEYWAIGIGIYDPNAAA